MSVGDGAGQLSVDGDGAGQVSVDVDGECDGCSSDEVCLAGECVTCSFKFRSSCYNLVLDKLTADEAEEVCQDFYQGSAVYKSETNLLTYISIIFIGCP